MDDHAAPNALGATDCRPARSETAAHLLIEHYHRTLDSAARIWDARNKSFLLLVGVVGASALLTASPDFTSRLADMLLARASTNADGAKVENVLPYYPSAVVNAMLLLVAFFLTMNLFQKTVSMIRYYKYVGVLESEIRRLLGIADPSMVFARESLHYWQERPRSFWIVRYAYIVILGALLAFLYWLRLGVDIALFSEKGDRLPLALDIVIGLPTFFVFLAYVAHSLLHDRRGAKR